MKKVNLPSKVAKEIKDLHAITVVRQVTHQTNVGAMERQDSKANATTVISMVTRLVNARRNKNLKANVTNARNKVTKHQNVEQRYSLQQNKLSKQYLVGITIPGADVIIVENMDTLG
ncbi:hypothetical protein SUGI_0566050 [Cryptomeria japonica]|nr:hypothetical protein SUGI_0566050 [Cryptomeria japonica]